MNESTINVALPSHLVPALNSLLAERAAALEADAARVGLTLVEPPAPPPRPVRRAVPVDAHLLAEGSAVKLDRGALQRLANAAGSCEVARAWILFCTRHLGGQRQFGAAGNSASDWALYCDDLVLELEKLDREAAKLGAVASERAAENAKPRAELQARIAQLEDDLWERAQEVNRAEIALTSAKAAVGKVEAELKRVREAIARRDPARLVIDQAEIDALSREADCSLQDAERTIRACRGNVDRASAWACGPGRGANGVLFPINFGLI